MSARLSLERTETTSRRCRLTQSVATGLHAPSPQLEKPQRGQGPDIRCRGRLCSYRPPIRLGWPSVIAKDRSDLRSPSTALTSPPRHPRGGLQRPHPPTPGSHHTRCRGELWRRHGLAENPACVRFGSLRQETLAELHAHAALRVAELLTSCASLNSTGVALLHHRMTSHTATAQAPATEWPARHRCKQTQV